MLHMAVMFLCGCVRGIQLHPSCISCSLLGLQASVRCKRSSAAGLSQQCYARSCYIEIVLDSLGHGLVSAEYSVYYQASPPILQARTYDQHIFRPLST
jgi:hypothetical protein